MLGQWSQSHTDRRASALPRLQLDRARARHTGDPQTKNHKKTNKDGKTDLAELREALAALGDDEDVRGRLRGDVPEGQDAVVPDVFLFWCVCVFWGICGCVWAGRSDGWMWVAGQLGELCGWVGGELDGWMDGSECSGITCMDIFFKKMRP